MLLLVVLPAVLTGQGCDGCQRSAVVPFKADAGAGRLGRGVGEPASPEAPEGDGSEGTRTFTPRTGQPLERGTRRVAVEGAPLTAPDGHWFRVLLPVDVGERDARDALVALEATDGTTTLAFARRRADGAFASPEGIGDLLGPAPGCALGDVELAVVAPSVAAARALRSCPASATPGAAGERERRTAVVALIDLDRRPRMSEALGLAPPSTSDLSGGTTDPGSRGGDRDPFADPRAPAGPLGFTIAPTPPSGAGEGEASASPPVVRLVLQNAPEDGLPALPSPAGSGGDPADGDDARSPGPGAPSPPLLILSYRRSPAGLTRDPAEPEATLQRLADDALQALRDEGPEPAGRAAQRALALHRLVCREPGAARLRVGAGPAAPAGLPCGASPAAAQAQGVLAAAAARGGQILAALAHADALTTPAPGLAPSPQDRRLVADALGALPRLDPDHRRLGPAVQTFPRPDVHRSRLAFLDEGRLLVRGERAQVLDVRSGEPLVPTPTLAPRVTSSVIADPAGRLAIAAVVRGCAGLLLEVVAADAIVAGVVAGRPKATPLLGPAAPRPGCPPPGQIGDTTTGSPVWREDDGGFEVLGWPPQGVLAARGPEVVLVPLTLDGSPAGAPRTLDPETPLPAPLVPGSITEDARLRVLARGDRLVVLHPGDRDRKPTLLEPGPPLEGGSDGPVADPAISPSGDRLAWVRGGRIVLWASEPPPTSPSPAAAEATSTADAPGAAGAADPGPPEAGSDPTPPER